MSGGGGGGMGGPGEPETRWEKLMQVGEMAIGVAAERTLDRLGFEEEDTSGRAPEIAGPPEPKQLAPAQQRSAPAFTPPERQLVEHDDEMSGEFMAEADPEPD